MKIGKIYSRLQSKQTNGWTFLLRIIDHSFQRTNNSKFSSVGGGQKIYEYIGISLDEIDEVSGRF